MSPTFAYHKQTTNLPRPILLANSNGHFESRIETRNRLSTYFWTLLYADFHSSVTFKCCEKGAYDLLSMATKI